MRRIAVLIASAAINASTIPAVAAECTSNKDIDAFCSRSPTAQSQPANGVDKETSCRAYAVSSYESEMRRQTADRIDGAPMLTALHSVINAFNDLLATKCGS